MRYALVSDVHANLPALRAVLADILRHDVDAIHHLGDLVGYAPWPNEVIAAVRDSGITGVSGNYDTTVAMGYRHCGCRSENAHQEDLAHQSFMWTLAHTTPESKQFLAALPFRLDIRPSGGHVTGRTVHLVHGNESLNTVYVSEDRSDGFLAKMAASMAANEGDIICFGHTHKPWHRVVEGVHFVNAGSVGRPKDGDPRACYAILAVGERSVSVAFERVAYDVDETTRAIVASELPDEFADFLRTGGAPLSASSAAS